MYNSTIIHKNFSFSELYLICTYTNSESVKKVHTSTYPKTIKQGNVGKKHYVPKFPLGTSGKKNLVLLSRYKWTLKENISVSFGTKSKTNKKIFIVSEYHDIITYKGSYKLSHDMSYH